LGLLGVASEETIAKPLYGLTPVPDVMTIADEVDAQLTQTMGSYIKAMHKAAVA
jgi:hypothetical protein